MRRSVVSKGEAAVTLPAWSFMGEKMIRGSVYGSTRPHVDIPPAARRRRGAMP
jgi:Zn-dependent alcohol dehydrogenase